MHSTRDESEATTLATSCNVEGKPSTSSEIGVLTPLVASIVTDLSSAVVEAFDRASNLADHVEESDVSPEKTKASQSHPRLPENRLCQKDSLFERAAHCVVL